MVFWDHWCCNFKVLMKFSWVLSESNRERIAFGPLLITVLYLALKKTGFSKKKKFSPKKKKFFYLFSMQLFSADAMVFSKKFKKNFLTPKKWKNRPKKLLIIGPDPFLRQSSPGHSPQPRSSFPFYKKSNAILSLLLSEQLFHDIYFSLFRKYKV